MIEATMDSTGRITSPWLFCACGDGQKLASCVKCTPGLLCVCGEGQRLASCVECNPGAFCGCAQRDGKTPRLRINCSIHNPKAFCDCGTGDGAARLRKDCSECNPKAFCSCARSDGEQQLRTNCSECNPKAFCGCVQSDGKTPRLRINCSIHNPKAFCDCGTDGAARRRTDCSECNPDAFCDCGTDGAARRRTDCPRHKKGGWGEGMTDGEYYCSHCTSNRNCNNCAPAGVYDVCYTGADNLGMKLTFPSGSQFHVAADPITLASSAAGVRAGDTIYAVNGNDVQGMAFEGLVSLLRVRPVQVNFARCMERRMEALEEASAEARGMEALEEASAEARGMEALEEASAEAGGSDGGGGGVGGGGRGGRGGVGDDQRPHPHEQVLIAFVNKGCNKTSGLKFLNQTHGGGAKHWNDLWKKLVEGDAFRGWRVKASEGGNGKENPAKRQKTD
jgi:hypothetical protein